MGEREQMHAKLIKIAHELREKDVSILQFCMPNFHKHIPCKPLPNGTLVITEGNDVPVLTNVALEALLSEDTFPDAAGNTHPGFGPAYIRVARACMLEGRLCFMFLRNSTLTLDIRKHEGVCACTRARPLPI